VLLIMGEQKWGKVVRILDFVEKLSPKSSIRK
jgi:hypothetical protein